MENFEGKIIQGAEGNGDSEGEMIKRKWEEDGKEEDLKESVR
jgi:hypothetical protein